MEFIANSKEERWKSYQDTGEWLTHAQEELKQKVEESERRLQDFARRNGLIIASSQNATEEKLRQLSEELARCYRRPDQQGVGVRIEHLEPN